MSDDLYTIWQKLGFRLPCETFEALLVHAGKNSLSPVQLLESLAEAERLERDERNLSRRTRMAYVGNPKPLAEFDYNHPTQIDRELYEHLYGSLCFVKQKENILFRGPPGLGKTTLAQHIGLRSLAQGYTVKFCTLPTALADLMRQESVPATERRLKYYTSPDVLILDELGYVPCDSRAADLLFHIVSQRHERKSIIITTNLGYKMWGTVFQEASCLGALVDRFAQHCHTMDIDGESWRAGESQQKASKAPRKKRP